MSSGGIDWAYRMIGQHKLDALGVAVVLHLGLRDVPNFRTDRGIARALNKDRASVRRATLRLEALGLIERRSGQWVACETVAIVEGRPDAPKPDASHSDGVGASGPRPCDREAAGGVRPPGVGASGPPKRGREAPTRKEKDEKKEPAALFFDFEKVGRVARAEILAGRSALVAGAVLKPGSAQWLAILDWLRNGASCSVSPQNTLRQAVRGATSPTFRALLGAVGFGVQPFLAAATCHFSTRYGTVERSFNNIWKVEMARNMKRRSAGAKRPAVCNPSAAGDSAKPMFETAPGRSHLASDYPGVLFRSGSLRLVGGPSGKRYYAQSSLLGAEWTDLYSGTSPQIVAKRARAGRVLLAHERAFYDQVAGVKVIRQDDLSSVLDAPFHDRTPESNFRGNDYSRVLVTGGFFYAFDDVYRAERMGFSAAVQRPGLRVVLMPCGQNIALQFLADFYEDWEFLHLAGSVPSLVAKVGSNVHPNALDLFRHDPAYGTRYREFMATGEVSRLVAKVPSDFKTVF